MTGTEGEIVYTRDASSGRVHKRVRHGGRLVPYGGEQDNLDDAGEFEVIESLDNTEADDLCVRCFGSPEAA